MDTRFISQLDIFKINKDKQFKFEIRAIYTCMKYLARILNLKLNGYS